MTCPCPQTHCQYSSCWCSMNIIAAIAAIDAIATFVDDIIGKALIEICECELRIK